MRKIIYIMLFAVLAQACSQHVADGQAEGFLQLNEIHVASDVSVEPLGTRAVHDGLRLTFIGGMPVYIPMRLPILYSMRHFLSLLVLIV